MQLLIILVIFVLIILILYISIPWTGDLSFKLKDTLKSVYIKLNHKHMNKPLNKKICKENLEALSKILNDNKITFWLSEGTALGARREGDFIEHDDDVDIGIWYTDFNKFKKIIPLLKQNKFKISLEIHNNTFIRLECNNEIIDIDFTGKYLYCEACNTKRVKCKTCNELLKYLKNMSYINFLGHKYLCPDIDYLEYLYGPDWKTPRKEKFINMKKNIIK